MDFVEEVKKLDIIYNDIMSRISPHKRDEVFKEYTDKVNEIAREYQQQGFQRAKQAYKADLAFEDMVNKVTND